MGLLDQIYDRARGLLGRAVSAPAELAALASPQMNQRVNQVMNNPRPANKQQWLDAGMELSGMAPIGGLLAHTVYHGSPHKFSKFDMSKIGTGEGAQAYGHGLYFAENPAVAMSYQDMLGKKAGAAHPSLTKLQNKQSLYVEKGGFDSVDDLRNAIDEGDIGLLSTKQAEAFKKRQEQYLKTWDEVKQGNLYKVDIPDESIPRMLDWDKPLSEQAPEVKKALKKSQFYKDARGRYKETGQWYDDPSQKTGEALLKYLRSGTSDMAGGANQYGMAEDYLKAQGIPGIRYLDGMSRGAGKGSSNYVLFDDQLPRILEINGQPTGLLSWADEAALAKRK